MQDGKLPREHLDSLLKRIPSIDPSVLLGPATGEDAAALALEHDERILVAAADPVTFVTRRPGWFAVHINANDLSTRGARPRWFLATILLPPASDDQLPRQLIEEIVEACASVGASLVGGHTEVTPSVTRPIVAGTMLGTLPLPNGRLLRTADAQPGDSLVLSRGIAIEGTAVLGVELAGGTALPDDVCARARALLEQPGISVLVAANLAADVAGVHAMHDPTEGGLATALHELCDARGAGVTVDADAIVVLPETRAVCDILGLNPLGLLASGALLASVEPAAVDHLLHTWAEAGISAARIGELTNQTTSRSLRRGSRMEPLPTFARDELARYFTAT